VYSCTARYARFDAVSEVLGPNGRVVENKHAMDIGVPLTLSVRRRKKRRKMGGGGGGGGGGGVGGAGGGGGGGGDGVGERGGG